MKDIIRIKTEQKFLEFLLLNKNISEIKRMCFTENYIIPNNLKEIYCHFLSEAKEEEDDYLLSENAVSKNTDNLSSLRTEVESLLSSISLFLPTLLKNDKITISEMYDLKERITELKVQLNNSEVNGARFFFSIIWGGIKMSIGILAIFIGFFTIISLGLNTALPAVGAVIFFGGFVAFWSFVLGVIRKAIKLSNDGNLNEEKKKEIRNNLTEESIKFKKLIAKQLK